jgi:hypothetical protein
MLNRWNQFLSHLGRAKAASARGAKWKPANTTICSAAITSLAGGGNRVKPKMPFAFIDKNSHKALL